MFYSHPLLKILILLTMVFSHTVALARSDRPKELIGVDITEKLGQDVIAEAQFKDHLGNPVQIADYLKDGLPVLMTLNYYRCKMLCDLQLNGLLRTLKDLDWVPGERFRIVTVGIDPRESPEIAALKRESYIEDLGRGNVDWTFLTGDKANISMVARSVGFGYQYDASTDQYAHVAVAIMISPKGKITRYLYGIEYSAQDLKRAILQAETGQVTSSGNAKPSFSCFQYIDASNANTQRTWLIMRIGGGLGLFVFVSLLITLWRRDLRDSKKLSSPGGTSTS